MERSKSISSFLLRELINKVYSTEGYFPDLSDITQPETDLFLFVRRLVLGPKRYYSIPFLAWCQTIPIDRNVIDIVYSELTSGIHLGNFRIKTELVWTLLIREIDPNVSISDRCLQYIRIVNPPRIK